MSLTASQKTLRGLIAVAALFLVSIGTMSYLSSRLATLNASTLRTYQVLCELKDTLTSLLDVETGNRGYALTLRKEFLEPYRWGIKNTHDHLDALGKLLREPDDAEPYANLRKIAEEKIAYSKKVVVTADASKENGAILVGEGEGKRIMDRFRQVSNEIATRKTKLLDRRIAELARAQELVWASIGVLSLIALGILIWVFKISTKALEEEKNRVSELNKEIEQRKRIEKALKDATTRLVSSNTDLQQFAYVASHDLQEPLRAVSGFVQLLAAKNKATFDEESLVWVNHAVEGSQRMRTLINDLLSYARIESRGKDFVTVDLEEIASRVKQDLSVTIEETKATVTFDKMPTVNGDPTQLAQLFQNLINNAIKFRSTADPFVTIKAEVNGMENVISVEDNGRGFDMEHAERIFVIFQRLQGRTEAPGTGIGLAVCKKIVERHHGRIWVESKVGEGTTFLFTLPILKIGDKNDDSTN
ncbi:MAG: CHASE3 domain-containing protein [Cyanobacteria bacterium SZAS-4]|nr:CHASE3 domain-containing protein [Cyanobacteria bacterium SZAS-4]